MTEETEKITENDNTDAHTPRDAAIAEPQDMQANLNSLNDAVANLGAMVGTLSTAVKDAETKDGQSSNS